MRLKQLSLAAAAILVLGFTAGAARAEDFTFTVPVELASLPPDMDYGWVYCDLEIREPGSVARRVGNRGRGFSISGGAYRGELTVAVNSAPHISPSSVTHYFCWLTLRGTLRGTAFTYDFRDGDPPLPGAPGAPVMTRVRGTVR